MPASLVLAAAPALSQQDECHGQRWPCGRSSGTAPGLGQAEISPGESPEPGGKNLWAPSWSNWCNSCWGGDGTRSENQTRLHRHSARAGAELAAGAPERRV